MKSLRNCVKKFRKKYFSIYGELVKEELIECKLDASDWGITRERENETWGSELRLMDEIKNNFEMGIKMIETGEADQMLIAEENK